MKIINPGLQYFASNYENKEHGIEITFANQMTALQLSQSKKEIFTQDKGDPKKLITVTDGITVIELLNICLDRLIYENTIISTRDNLFAIENIDTVILKLSRQHNLRKRLAEKDNQKS